VHLTVLNKIECHTMIEKAGEHFQHVEDAIMSDHLVIRLQIQESRHSQHCAPSRHSPSISALRRMRREKNLVENIMQTW